MLGGAVNESVIADYSKVPFASRLTYSICDAGIEMGGPLAIAVVFLRALGLSLLTAQIKSCHYGTYTKVANGREGNHPEKPDSHRRR
jgi:hypothetical protein